MPYPTTLLATSVFVLIAVLVWYRPSRSSAADLGVATDTVLSTKLTTKTARATDGAPAYQAPFDTSDTHPDIVPNSYIIYLIKGHTVEDVSRVSGVNVQQYLRDGRVLQMGEGAPLMLGVYGVDDATIAAIRSDPGVEMISHNVKVEVPVIL